MIKYTLKHPIDGHVSLNIGMLPGHKRPSIWIDKYGVSQIIGSLKSESAARDLEQIIDFMLNPEEMIEPEPTEESIDNYDFARDDMNFDASALLPLG